MKLVLSSVQMMYPALAKQSSDSEIESATQERLRVPTVEPIGIQNGLLLRQKQKGQQSSLGHSLGLCSQYYLAALFALLPCGTASLFHRSFALMHMPHWHMRHSNKTTVWKTPHFEIVHSC